MNEATIFLVGIIVFAITVYGVVMAGGIALTKVMLDQEPQALPGAQDSQLTSITSTDTP